MSKERILVLQFAPIGAYPPTQNLCNVLADRGYSVIFVGAEAHGYRGLSHEHNPLVRYLEVPRRLGVAKLGLVVQYANFAIKALGVAVRYRPKFVFGIEIYAVPILMVVDFAFRSRYGYHEFDRTEVNVRRLGMRCLIWLRRRVALRAAFVSFSSQLWLEKFRTETFPSRCPAFVVWNCPKRSDIAPPILDSGDNPKHTISLYYHGNVSPATLPITVLSAMKLVGNRFSLKIAALQPPAVNSYLSEFLEKAELLGVKDRIELRYQLTRVQCLKYARTADIGLCISKRQATEDGWYMPGAANKPFDYLTAGLGLIVNDSDIWRRFFTDRGTAISCDPDSPEEIAGAILTLVNQPAVLAEMRSVAYGLLDSEWNFERQIAGILTIVDMVTGKGMVPQ